MRAGEDDQFVPVGHRVFDACVIGVLGYIPILVYLSLRRYIWRDADSGSRDMRQMVRDGRLASCIVQSNLAVSLGISRWSVNRAIYKLARLGWVEIQDVPGRIPRYVLGDVEQDAQGRTYARFWADGELLTLEVWLEAESMRRFNTPFATLLFEDRIKLTESWFRQRVPDFFLPEEEEVLQEEAQDKGQVAFSFGASPPPVLQVVPRMPKKKERTKKASPYKEGLYTELELVWRECLDRLAPGVTVAAWQVRERSQIKGLLDRYGPDVVQDALRYVCRRWDFLRKRFFRGQGGVPSIGFLVKFHDVIVPEAQQWHQVETVKRERDAWFADNPHEYAAPPELEARYEQIRPLLRSLGMEG